MDYLDTGLLFYAFGPPLLALAFCGLMALSNRRRTAALDRDIARYRAQVAAERAVHEAAADARRAA